MQRIAFAFASLLAAGCTHPVDFAPGTGDWPIAPTPAWAHQARLATTDSGDDTLAFIAPSLTPMTPMMLLGMMPVGDIPVELEGPHHIAASPDGATIYVPLSNYVPGSGTGPHGAHGTGNVLGSLLKIDAATVQKTAEATLDPNPGDVLLTKDGKTAYVSHYDLLRLQKQLTMGEPEAMGYAAIAVVDTASMARPPLYPVCATAHGLGLSADEKTVYVTCVQTDQLAILDVASHAVTRVPMGPSVGMPLTPNYQPYALTVAPDGKVWIACNGNGGIGNGFSGLRVYDPAAQAFDESLSVPFMGQGMASVFLADGKTVVGVSRSDDKLLFIDASQTPPMVTFELGLQGCTNAHTLKMSSDGKTGWAVCEGDHVSPGSIVAVDLVGRAYLGTLAVGVFPDGVVELPPAP